MPTQFVTRYDFRLPGATAEARREQYARALEQVRYLDAQGSDPVMLSEHHVSEDGYLPSPVTVAAAFAGATTRVPLSVSALLVNLYDPIRLAEDIAVLDNLSGGRVSYTFGLGYRREEYDLFGAPWQTRGRDIEARITTMLRAWTGESFEHEGRTVRVLPRPLSQPHPFCFYGGGSLAAARRAGRLGLHFQPQHADPTLKDAYEAECRAHGREPGLTLLAPPGPAYVFCSADPEAFWERHGHHLLADAVSYQQWHGEAASYVVDTSTTVEQMRSAGKYVVLTPDELVVECRAKRIRLVTMHPCCGGLPAEPSWETLRLVNEVVRPALG